MKRIIRNFKFNLREVVLCFLAGYLSIQTMMLITSPSSGINIGYSQSISLPAFVLIVMLFSAFLIIADGFNKRMNISGKSFLFSLFTFFISLLSKEKSFITYIIAFIVMMVAFYCYTERNDCSFLHKDISRDKTIIITVTSAALILLLLISVLRYYTYSSPNYDFGLFCNMFYNMKETGKAVSTSERDKLLSHFAVHISPIFYILLPFYLVFPSPVTLAVAQPLIVFSSVIPLYLLAKHLKLSKNTVTFFTVAFALYTPMITGCFYDLHENCFLTPLLLWMFYFFEKDKKIPMFISMLLVLSVKEDAFVYILFFAAFIFVSRKKYITGSSMAVLALLYFLLATAILTKYGEGIMSDRYDNLSDGGSLIDALKTIIVNPGFAIKQLLSTRDNNMDKVFYIAQLLCPVVFIPFTTKDLSKYFLILPVFINLLTTYPYQYDTTFQYNFGITAFLFYFSLLNLTEKNKVTAEKLSAASVIASVLLFSMLVVPKTTTYVSKAIVNNDIYTQIETALDTIPEDAEVTSSTYFIAHIADRNVIYEDEYHDTPSTEYFVLDRTRAAAEGREKMYLDAGYKLIYEVEGVIEIYRNEYMAQKTK